MQVLFVAGFGPVVRDEGETRSFYIDTLGLPLRGEDYLYTPDLEGVKHFALWPLSQAAESCFGTVAWPETLPVPHAWLEFDVEDLAAATEELKSRGYQPLVENREEPWGQTVTRLLAPDGLLVGLTHTPPLRKDGDQAGATGSAPPSNGA